MSRSLCFNSILFPDRTVMSRVHHGCSSVTKLSCSPRPTIAKASNVNQAWCSEISKDMDTYLNDSAQTRTQNDQYYSVIRGLLW